MDIGSFWRASNSSDVIWFKNLTVSVWLLYREETEVNNGQKQSLEDIIVIQGKDGDVLDRIVELRLWGEVRFGIYISIRAGKIC